MDRAALDAALAVGFPCGGWCPWDREAEDGVISEKYPLDPVPCGGYRQRTLETRDLCIREKKPFVLINAAANGDPCHRDLATTWQMPKGEPESRLWVAVAGRVHDARTARPVGEHPIDARDGGRGERQTLI